MPFTPAHAVAVLPLRRKLPFAALAIGAMGPDFPYYFPIADRALFRATPWVMAAGALVTIGACLVRAQTLDLSQIWFSVLTGAISGAVGGLFLVCVAHAARRRFAR